MILNNIHHFKGSLRLQPYTCDHCWVGTEEYRHTNMWLAAAACTPGLEMMTQGQVYMIIQQLSCMALACNMTLIMLLCTLLLVCDRALIDDAIIC